MAQDKLRLPWSLILWIDSIIQFQFQDCDRRDNFPIKQGEVMEVTGCDIIRTAHETESQHTILELRDRIWAVNYRMGVNEVVAALDDPEPMAKLSL